MNDYPSTVNIFKIASYSIVPSCVRQVHPGLYGGMRLCCHVEMYEGRLSPCCINKDSISHLTQTQTQQQTTPKSFLYAILKAIVSFLHSSNT